MHKQHTRLRQLPSANRLALLVVVVVLAVVVVAPMVAYKKASEMATILFNFHYYALQLTQTIYNQQVFFLAQTLNRLYLGLFRV